jgi:hypothetical protein
VNEPLEQIVPPIERTPNWDDVIQRATFGRRRRVIAVCVIALFFVGASAAVAAALGGFDAWLRGTPGKPAPAAEQRAFSAAHRSWLGFPETTKLRELIRTRAGGQTYVLYGFRSGESLCLQLDAVELKRTTGPACAPASTVTHVSAPIVVVEAQTGFVDRASRPVSAAGFGIAADDVAAVTARTTESTYPAQVVGNAFLWVESEPTTGERLLGLTARLRDGRRVSIVPRSWSRLEAPLVALPRAHGPTRIQARIPHPHLSHDGPTKPDPLSNLAIESGFAGIQLIVDGKLTASSSLRFFERGPMDFMVSGMGSDQFKTVAGVAADGVARISVFLADGERQDAALRNNAFSAVVPAVYGPMRVVAYDRVGRVVGVQTTPAIFAGRPAPRAALRGFRTLLRAAAPGRAVAELAAGPTIRGTRCWRVAFSDGSSVGTSCQPFVGWTSVHAVGRDVFVFGRGGASPRARVEVWFDDGDAIVAKKREGFYLAAIPEDHLSRARHHAFVVTIVPSILGGERRASRQSIFFKQR